MIFVVSDEVEPLLGTVDDVMLADLAIAGEFMILLAGITLPFAVFTIILGI